MNRLQKKCFIASAGIHLLLALVLFVGPGFLSAPSKPDDFTVLDFVPAKTVDALVAPGGGNPKAKPPPAAPPQPPQPQPQPAAAAPPPEPQPKPEKVREPDPLPEPKPAAHDEESFEPAKEKRPRKIEISTKLVTRKRDSSEDRKAREEARMEAEARREAKAAADARRRLARQIGQAADYIGSELSGGTSIEMQGPGGGGLPYANFWQAVKSIYANAWVLPDGVENDAATTVASVTIARSGKVVDAHIVKFSGDAVVDHSVQTTLERVRNVPPFPEDTKDEVRTVRISFNVKQKKLLG